MQTSKYYSKSPEVRAILDRPRWQEWLEYELEMMREICPDFKMKLEDFKPDALEWTYYHDACLKSGSHEIVELLSRMAEVIPKKYHRYLHRAMTSSNVIDACNHRRWKKLDNCQRHLISELRNIVMIHVKVPGFTHGILATPTSLHNRMSCILYGPSDVKLLPDKIRTSPTGYISQRQAYGRSRYFPIWSNLAMRSYGLAQLAQDYRFYATGKFGVELKFKGTTSSAMPNKNNPSEFERIISLDQLIRGEVCTLINTQVQWLDRDLTHSAMERHTIDWLWEHSFYQLEEMIRLVKGTEIRVTGYDYNRSYERMNQLQEEGNDWSTSRRLSTDEQYWLNREADAQL